MSKYTKRDPIPLTDDQYDLYVEGIGDDGEPFVGYERSPELLAKLNTAEE